MTAIDVKRIDHVSYTVADLDRSEAFYTGLGFTRVNRYSEAGPHVDHGAGVQEADMDILLLRHAAGGIMLELIRYTRHAPRRAVRNYEVGSAHLGFVVGDVDAAYEVLRSQGVEFISEPNEDQYGEKWVYLRDPDGIPVELMQPSPRSQRTEEAT